MTGAKSIAVVLDSIQAAIEGLRASLRGPDSTWFESAFGFCDQSLSRLRAMGGRDATPAPRRLAPRPTADQPSLDAAKTIASTLIQVGDRIRTEVFQQAEDPHIKDEAADFIGKIYFDLLKPLFAAYPELTPKELKP